MGIAEALAGQRVYLDTNIFIYAIEGVPPYADAMRELFAAIDAGRVEAATSELTLAEVLVKPLITGDAELQEVYQEVLREGGPLHVASVSRAVLLGAAGLRARIDTLRLPDAIHMATAQLCGCGAFLTNDQSLRGPTNVRVLLCSHLAGS